MVIPITGTIETKAWEKIEETDSSHFLVFDPIKNVKEGALAKHIRYLKSWKEKGARCDNLGNRLRHNFM